MQTIPTLLEAIESDLEKIRNTSQQKIQRKYYRFQLFILEGSWILNLIIFIIYLLGFYAISQIHFDSAETNWILLSCWSVSPFFGFLFGMDVYSHFTFMKIRKITTKIEKINKLHKAIFINIDWVQSPEEILDTIALVQKEILGTIPLLKKQNLRIMKSYISKEIEVILLFLDNYKNDLLLEVKKKTTSLHVATHTLKSLEWWKAFQRTIDIQNTRIELQIKSFKNLEKLLVKI